MCVNELLPRFQHGNGVQVVDKRSMKSMHRMRIAKIKGKMYIDRCEKKEDTS